MAVSAQKSRVLVGSLDLSGYSRSFSTDSTTEALDVTVITSTAKAFIAGQTSGSFSADLILDTDTTAGGLHAIVTAWKGTPAPITYCPSGAATLAEALMVNGLQTSVSPSASLTGTADASVAAVTDGPVDAGFIIDPATAITATGNGTARDLTAQTTNGGVAHLHVSAFSGLTSNTVTIEDSANGSTGWATIATFTAATGITSQRLAITGTVKQYLRVVDTVVGTGSCTRTVAFARR